VTPSSTKDTDGWFVGAALSGTNVGAGVITFIDPLGKYVVNSVASTGAVAGNVTATYTGYIIQHCNRPFAQGAIT
jgi:energy-converting hydrogenase Eha subunit A